MEFLSICSGIEAASVAWEPLGWKAVGFSEIDRFACAVLAHRFPNVPNYGDMTSLTRRILLGEVPAPDVLCGGTPCQAFSVAGLRESLSDARGNLSLIFCEIADAIDIVRSRAGLPPCIIIWENVPGVLSTKDNAFGCFLAGLAGENDALEPPGGRWSNAGAVYGPARSVAWRTLDAQYFGLAQRRKRVFVVASAREGFDPASVLFEWHGVRRDTAPSRETRKVAPTIPSRSTAGGGLGTDFDCDGGVVQVCPTLRAGGNSTGGDRPPGTDVDTADSLIPVGIFQDSEFGVAQYDSAGTLRAGRIPAHQMVMQPVAFTQNQRDEVRTLEVGTPLVPVHVPEVAGTFRSADGGSNVDHGRAGHLIAPALARCDTAGEGKRNDWETCTMVAHTLRGEGFDASEDGTGRGTPLVPVITGAMPANVYSGGMGGRVDMAAQGFVQPVLAFAENSRHELKLEGGDGQRTGALSTGGGKPGQGVPMVVAFHGSQDPDVSGEVTHPVGRNQGLETCVAVALRGRDGGATAELGDDAAFTLRASTGGGDKPHVMAYTTKLHNTASNNAGKLFEERSPCLDANSPAPALLTPMAVRRLTPRECERLQGFPDDWTLIPWRGKPADQCPDGPRYKAIGNSWAVPVARWVGERIQMVEDMREAKHGQAQRAA